MEKGLDLEKTYADNRDIQHIPSLLSLSSRSPNHSFNLVPSISYSGGRSGPPQIVEVLGLRILSGNFVQIQCRQILSKDSLVYLLATMSAECILHIVFAFV